MRLLTPGRQERISLSLNPKGPWVSRMGLWFLSSSTIYSEFSVLSPLIPPHPLFRIKEALAIHPHLTHPSILSGLFPPLHYNQHYHKTQLSKVAKGAWPYVPVAIMEPLLARVSH